MKGLSRLGSISGGVIFLLVLLWVSLGLGISTAVEAAPTATCTVRVNSTSTDYGDLQSAINNANPAGDLLKVAGDCVGTTTVNGLNQVGYITQSLTLRGGYTTTNWVTSDPIANPTTLDADSTGRVLVISPTASSAITVENLNLTGGSVLDIDGGGVYITGTAEVVLNQLNIFGNVADWSDDFGYGGGIYNAAVLTVTNSAIYQNYTRDEGGGLYAEMGSTTAVQNSTISGNEAAFGGGGIRSLAPVSVTFSTIVANTGGGIWADSNNAAVANSIVVGQSDDCDGVTSNGYNVLGGSCTSVATDISFAGNPFAGLLAPLADNGGGTLTHALDGNGVAIDAAEAASCPSRDQRGEARVASQCDIGAYEAIIYLTKVVSNIAPQQNEVVTYTIQVQNPTLAPFTNGQLSDVLPVGVALAGPVALMPLSGTVGAFPTIVTDIVLPSGGVLTVTFPVTVTAVGGTEIINTAVFTSPDLATTQTANALLQVSNCYARPDSNGVVYGRLQEAIDAATNGDLIRIAGVCDLVETVNSTPQVGYIDQDLTLRGGYTATNWVVSDVNANPTVIDARQNGRGLRINGNITVLVENLTITNGDASGLGGAQFGSDGGAAILNTDAQLTVNNVSLFDNVTDAGTSEEARGGALASDGGDVTITNSDIYNNFLSGSFSYGGGVMVANGMLNISNSNIHHNTAEADNSDGSPNAEGGGLYVADNVTLIMEDSRLYNNTVQGQGGGLSAGSNANLTISTSELHDNAALQQGGGLYLSRITANISQSRIYSNTVLGSIGSSYDRQGGGGLYVASASQVTLSQSMVASNTVNTRGLGGGMAVNCWRCTNVIVVENSTFSGNTAVEGGGGFSSYIQQDFINSTNSDITFDFVTFIHNNATSGNGHAINQERETASATHVSQVTSALTYRNSLIAGNGGANECRNNATHGSIAQTSGGYNLFIAGAGCTDNGTTDQTVADQATLFATVVNDVLTSGSGTHPLNAAGGAVEAIPDGVNGCVGGTSVDQRGAVRADGANRGDNACDVGAYELSLQTPTAVTLRLNEVSGEQAEMERNTAVGLVFLLLIVTIGATIVALGLQPHQRTS